MREYLAALQAIWTAWRSGEPLRFKGEHYRFGLMTPFFRPEPMDHPIPVYLAGVGPYLSRLAGEVCQGFHIHPFHTIRYLEDVVLPELGAGAQSAGRTLEDIERSCHVLVATGATEEEMQVSLEAVRLQIAFYASTPSYRAVLDTHGWDVGPHLSAMSRRGEWDGLAELISDEMVREVAVVAPVDGLAAAIADRYRGILHRVGFYASRPVALDEEEWAGIVDQLHEI